MKCETCKGHRVIAQLDEAGNQMYATGGMPIIINCPDCPDQWVQLIRHPRIYVNLKDGQTANFGDGHGPGAEYISTGLVSYDVLVALREKFDDR